MSTVESGRRVALLARPGAARDCVRGALLEVGADVVAEEDPVSADPEAVRAAAPQVLMIVLDAGAEDALGRFDVVIGDPSIEVMFEEADVAVAREGWEAARWRRHLAAKLNHRDDVLPPVASAAAGVPAADALSLQIEELIAVDEAAGGADAEPALALPATASAGEDFSIFDPVAAEAGDAQDFVLTVDGLELDTTAFDSAADAVLPPVTGPDFSASDFDPLLAELDVEMPEPAPLASASDWEGGLVEDFGAPAPGTHTDTTSDWDASAGDVFAAAPRESAPEAPAPAAASAGFGELSLADDTPVAAPAARGGFTRDLNELEQRISSLQLVDDAAPAAGSTATAVAEAAGAVLVLAGLGGPDAVRQFLGALPAGFPRAVLVRQRLDGARYDKLVAQMQRATQLPVALAGADRPLAAGSVYIVGDDVGIDAGSGLRFVAGSADRILDALPVSDSAVVMLSGGELADAERIAALSMQGLWVGAQAADGCYDPNAANALAARGATAAAPAELARQLAQRWSS